MGFLAQKQQNFAQIWQIFAFLVHCGAMSDQITMETTCLVGFLICEYQNFCSLSKKLVFGHKNCQIWPKICIFGHFGPNIGIFGPFRPMNVDTWDTIGIKIPKPPYISSLKMVGFVHFSNFLIPSEKYYKLQSCWITLYKEETTTIKHGLTISNRVRNFQSNDDI